MAVGGGELGAGVVPVVSARRLCWLLGLAGRGGGGGGAARAEGGGQPRVQTAHAQGGLGHHAAAGIWSASFTFTKYLLGNKYPKYHGRGGTLQPDGGNE